jgi:hypothetical protein
MFMIDGKLYECIEDSGATSPVMPLSIVNTLRAADPGEGSKQRQARIQAGVPIALVSIITFDQPINFQGVFGTDKCTHGAVVRIGIQGCPQTATVLFRLFDTPTILLPAPLLKKWGWDFMTDTFHNFGDTADARTKPVQARPNILARSRPRPQGPRSGQLKK